jgi:hypothetical protein
VVVFLDSHERVTEDPATTSTVPEELLAFNVIDTAPLPEEDEELEDEELLDDEELEDPPEELDEELVQF